jgi:hypothetical protein
MVGFERLLATDMREECKAGVRRTNRYEAARFLNVDDRLPTLFHSEPPALRRQVGEKRAEGNSVAAKTFCISSRRFDQRNAEEFGKLASCLVASLDKTPCAPRIPSQYSHINLGKLRLALIVGESSIGLCGLSGGQYVFVEPGKILSNFRKKVTEVIEKHQRLIEPGQHFFVAGVVTHPAPGKLI